MTTPVLPWLPDRHLDVVATLAHADELIGRIGDLVFEYVAESGDVFGLREVPNGAHYDVVVDWIAPIAKRIPLLVADTLVALRGAIEHTLFAEVVFQNGGPLDEKQARTIEMPAIRTYADYANWIKSRAKRMPSVMAQGSEILRRVETLQPFHRTVKPHQHPLALLTSYTNHAKHRNPAVTAVRLAAVVDGDRPPRSLDDFTPGPAVPMRVGDVVAHVPKGVSTTIDLFPAIGINRPDTDEWPYLMSELAEVSTWVREEAIPRLVTGSEPPMERIPASYNIGRGHEDERLAVGSGTLTTADERVRLRHAAGSARLSLVDVIAPTSGDLTRESVSEWLAQLDDGEVIQRVEKLRGFVSGLGSMTENARIVAELGEEAQQFANRQRD